MPKRTKKYEDGLIQSLHDPKEAAAYLNAHLDEDDSEDVFLLALRDVAVAHGVSEIAEHASLGRESLYKTLSKDGNPKLSTLRSLLKAVGLKISIESEKKQAS
ncbi:MAG: putative addiction module antidote protein [Xanthomonadaceae bacterium]|nr:putative addiction module antidote protein [Xanthomonadaceae bacterium]